MMPGASFKACLETPYLVKDPAVKGSTSQDLSQAEELLKTLTEKAKTPCEPSDLVLLSYKTMYCAAKALVHSAGYAVSNFRCLVAALKELFADKGLDKNLIDQLVAAQAFEGEAPVHVQAAETFVNKAKALLGGSR